MIAVLLFTESHLNIIGLQLEGASIDRDPVVQLRHGKLVICALVVVHEYFEAADVEGASYLILVQLCFRIRKIQ